MLKTNRVVNILGRDCQPDRWIEFASNDNRKGLEEDIAYMMNEVDEIEYIADLKVNYKVFDENKVVWEK